MPIRVNDFHAGLFIERLEMIEFTYISGKKRIYYVGKEGERCHCFRLKSNNDIIKVKRYSTEYPFDLIDTKGSKHSQDVFFQQVSFDKKTSTEKTKTKTLISWKLFERQNKLNPAWLNTTGEYEDVDYDSKTYRRQCDEVERRLAILQQSSTESPNQCSSLPNQNSSRFRHSRAGRNPVKWCLTLLHHLILRILGRSK